MSGDAVSEAVAAAFGRPSPSVTDLDRVAAEAFGRPVAADEALERDLVECGYTAGGARWVVSWMNDFGTAEGALSGGVAGVAPGSLPGLVAERGMAVLRRHGRVTEGAQAGTSGAGMSSAVSEARDRLVLAYGAATPGTTRQVAERYADAAVKQWLDSGTRQGLSEQQVVEGLNKQGAALAARARKGGRR